MFLLTLAVDGRNIDIMVFEKGRYLATKCKNTGGGKMSTATHMFTNFCTGCVAAAAAVIAIATLVTIVWVLFI